MSNTQGDSLHRLINKRGLRECVKKLIGLLPMRSDHLVMHENDEISLFPEGDNDHSPNLLCVYPNNRGNKKP